MPKAKKTFFGVETNKIINGARRKVSSNAENFEISSIKVIRPTAEKKIENKKSVISYQSTYTTTKL